MSSKNFESIAIDQLSTIAGGTGGSPIPGPDPMPGAAGAAGTAMPGTSTAMPGAGATGQNWFSDLLSNTKHYVEEVKKSAWDWKGRVRQQILDHLPRKM